MTSKLSLYNNALMLLGERKLANLTENRESRRALDAAWDDGAVSYCLEQGLWNFAIRSVQIDYSPSIEPDFGYQYAFNKPEDWVRTAAVCSDDRYNNPVTQYTDETGYWWADLQTLYIRFVSDDVSFGNDLSLWPQTFTKFVEAYLAEQICPRITQSDGTLDRIQKKAKKLLIDARSKDAMNEPQRFLPRGSWTSARLGNLIRRYDRSN